MANLMQPADFNKMFVQALTDSKFQSDLKANGFKALDARGYQHGVPPAIQAQIEQLIKPTAAAGAHCGVCGVCGTCGLCGEINLGAASAALWALFAAENGPLKAIL